MTPDEHSFLPDGPHAAWTIASYVREGARRWPEREYLRHGDESLTYAEAWRRIASIAAWLDARGIGRGDRVVMVTENRIETVLMFFAVAQIGAIAVILHPQMKPEGLRRILEQTEPKLGLLEQSTASLREEFGETPLVWADGGVRTPFAELIADAGAKACAVSGD
jgi:acyl-CoA synthetase (AMP-forming)/AMP-acid ligase II